MNLSAGTFTNYAATITNDGTLSLSNGEILNYSSSPVFTNNGLLTIGAGTTFRTTTGVFTNSGTVAVGANATFQVLTSPLNFDSGGRISLAGGGTLEVSTSTTLYVLGTITGAGTLAVDAGVTLDLGGGTLDLGAADGVSTLLLNGTIVDGTLQYDAGGGTVFGGGTIGTSVTVTGTSGIGPQTTINALDNLAGGTLDIKKGTASSNVLVNGSGTISNGVILQEDGLLSFSSGTLDGIIFRGPLNIFSSNEFVDFKDGLTVTTLAGGQPGTINLTGL